MNIYMMSPIGYTGYGYASLNILQNLMVGNTIGLTMIGNPNAENENQANLIKQSLSNNDIIPTDSICLKIWHQFDLLNKVGKGKYYAFPFFEVDSFNPKEIHHLNFPDELIVSSQWAKTIIEQNNINKKVNVVPMGVDTDIFDYTKNKETDKYVFITIGKWEKRKAHDIIIDCFNQAFDAKDNVELWMVTHNPFLSKQDEAEWLKLTDECKLANKIKVFPRQPTHSHIAEIISYANCGIYISRGEGWNMELLETMAMNKPVIVSDYSAHTEYCTKDNSFIVDMPEIELAIDNKWFFGTSNWGKIGQDQIEQTIAHMRYCYSNNIRENQGGLATAQGLSWKNTSHQLLGCMS